MQKEAPSPEEIEKLQVEIDRRLCQKHFYHFVRSAWKVVYPHDPFIDGWHIAAVCYHIQALLEGKAFSEHGDEADTLVINIPPGCGKSRVVSVFLSGWIWSKIPSAGQWYASFGYNVLDRDALDARRLIESKWYRDRFWERDEISLTDDQNQKRRYNNTAGGWRLAASVPSKVGFGEHPYILVVDDPHDPEQALGEQRMIANEAWDQKYSTRGVIKGVKKVIIAQRLGEGDLSGHVIENEDDIVHLRIPMWLEEEKRCSTNIEYLDIDQIGEDGNFKMMKGWSDPRKENGELMWPAGMGQKKVDKLKSRLRTSHMISAQLQQNPTSPDGDMFQAEWLDYVDAPPADGVAVRSWDKASSVGTKADFTAGALWVFDGTFFYLVHMKRGKWERKQREAIIMECAKSDIEMYPNYAIVFQKDPGAAGKDAVEVSSEKFIREGFRVRVEGTSSTKPTRADPLAEMMSLGRVKIVRGAWNSKFVSELLAFPNGRNDDQVDAAASGVTKISKANRYSKINRKLLLVTPEEEEELDRQAPPTQIQEYLSLIDSREDSELGVTF